MEAQLWRQQQRVGKRGGNAASAVAAWRRWRRQQRRQQRQRSGQRGGGGGGEGYSIFPASHVLKYFSPFFSVPLQISYVEYYVFT